MLKVGYIILCATAWRLGGWDKAKWSGYRDVLVPVALGLWYGITLRCWMLLVVTGLANIIRLGYGSYDPEHDDKPSFLAKITRDREGCYIRAIYGFLTSFVIGIIPAIYSRHYIGLIIYVAGNTILEFLLNKIKANDWVTELANGAGRGGVIWLI